MGIDELLGTLDSKTKNRFMKASTVSVEKLPTASVGMNRLLKGGFGRGRQTLIWGSKSASKSSFNLETIAGLQKQGLTCAWVDAEGSFDPIWATSLGVDTSELLLSESKSIDGVTEDVCNLLTSGIDFVCIDSITSLLPSGYFEKGTELKDGLEGTKQIGSISKELGVAVNKFNYLNKNTALVLISQARNQMNTYGATLKPTGGKAMEYFSSTIIKLWSSASEKEQIVGQVTRGDKIIQSPVGRKVTYTVEYNKIGPPNQIGAFDFYYDGDNVGIDYFGEVVDIAEAAGLIQKGGAWFSYEGEKFQGRPKVVQWLRENPAIAEELTKKLLHG